MLGFLNTYWSVTVNWYYERHTHVCQECKTQTKGSHPEFKDLSLISKISWSPKMIIVVLSVSVNWENMWWEKFSKNLVVIWNESGIYYHKYNHKI